MKIDKQHLLSVFILVFSLSFAWASDLFPWQRTLSTISKSQYSPVRKGTLFNISKTSQEYGSWMGIIKNGKKTYVHVGKNDPGYHMLIGFLSSFGFNVENILILGKVNYYIVWFSIIFVSLIYLFLSKNILLTSISFLLQIIFFKFSYPYMSSGLVDHHGLVFPITSIAFSLALAYFIKIRNMNTLTSILASFSLGFLIGILGLFRNSIGDTFLFGSMISLSIILFYSFRNRIIKNNIYIIVCIPLLYLGHHISYSYSQQIFYDQSKIKLKLDNNTPTKTISHGVWHNAFIGLGYYPNSWGISWSDYSGKLHAKKHVPDVVYLSERYYLTLKELYFKYLFQNPYEFIKNHLKKIYALLIHSLKALIIPIVLFLLVFKLKMFFTIRTSHIVTTPTYSFVASFILLSSIPIITHHGFSAGIITYTFHILLSYLLLSSPSFSFSSNDRKKI